MKSKTLCLMLAIISCLIWHPAWGQGQSWEVLMKAGNEALEQKRVSEAEQKFREALKLAEASKEKPKEREPKLAATLIKLALACHRQAKREEAEALASRAVQVLAKVIAIKPKNATEKFYQIEGAVLGLETAAAIFEDYQKYDEAEALYKKIIAMREEYVRIKEKPASNEDFLDLVAKATSGAQAKLADTYDQLARLYISQQRHKDAVPLYQQSLEAREKFFGAQTPAVAVSLTNLASLYATQENYPQAEPLFQRAVSIFEKANAMNRREAVMTLENYALLLKKTGRETEASSLLQKAQEIRSKLPR
jgi:tetratricopeptide (TPR) repeat protein